MKIEGRDNVHLKTGNLSKEALYMALYSSLELFFWKTLNPRFKVKVLCHYSYLLTSFYKQSPMFWAS